MEKIILFGLAVIAVLVVSYIAFAGELHGAKDYLTRHGVTVTKIEHSLAGWRCTNGGKSRKTFNFEGTRDGTDVHGYICWGGLAEAVIHYEN